MRERNSLLASPIRGRVTSHWRWTCQAVSAARRSESMLVTCMGAVWERVGGMCEGRGRAMGMEQWEWK